MQEFDKLSLRDTILITLAALGVATAKQIFNWIDLRKERRYNVGSVYSELKRLSSFERSGMSLLSVDETNRTHKYQLHHTAIADKRVSAKIILNLKKEFEKYGILGGQKAREIAKSTYASFTGDKTAKDYKEKFDNIISAGYFKSERGFLTPQSRLLVDELAYIMVLAQPFPKPIRQQTRNLNNTSKAPAKNSSLRKNVQSNLRKKERNRK